MDLSVKLPSLFRDREAEIRSLIGQQLNRGKIDLLVTLEDLSETPQLRINKELAKAYYRELTDLLNDLGETKNDLLLPVVMKMPDVMQTERYEASESEGSLLLQGIEEAVGKVREFRLSEGAILENDMRMRIGLILNLLDTITPFETARITEIRERLRTGFENLTGPDNLSITPDKNRFEQELLFYLERLDITEEKVRLQKHCDYFLDTLNEGDQQGKKLGFISQEIGREINTIGSKASHAEIQKIVVRMKDELEKVKEQLGNIL